MAYTILNKLLQIIRETKIIYLFGDLNKKKHKLFVNTIIILYFNQVSFLN